MDYNDQYLECPQCGGEGHALGQLGNLLHCSCRACGWTFSVDAPNAEECEE